MTSLLEDGVIAETPERPVLTFIDARLRLESKNVNIEACRNKSLR
jgi:hypothetical protein